MKHKLFSINVFLCVCIFFFLLVFPGFSQKVKIEEKDGVIIIKNPKKPAKVPGAPTTLTLEEDLRIGVEEGEDEYMFGFLRSVQVDNDENIYVLDAEYLQVKVYDKNGKHIRSFGKKGKGPGEFGLPSRMIITTDEKLAMLDSMNRRFSVYSKEGECLKEINLGKLGSVSRAWPASQGNI